MSNPTRAALTWGPGIWLAVIGIGWLVVKALIWLHVLCAVAVIHKVVS